MASSDVAVLPRGVERPTVLTGSAVIVYRMMSPLGAVGLSHERASEDSERDRRETEPTPEGAAGTEER